MEISNELKKTLDSIESHIIDHEGLSDREKMQSWVWVYSHLVEGRFDDDDLLVLVNHLEENKFFFKKLLRNLERINDMIDEQDKVGLTAKMQEAIELMQTLQKIESLKQ